MTDERIVVFTVRLRTNDSRDKDERLREILEREIKLQFGPTVESVKMTGGVG